STHRTWLQYIYGAYFQDDWNVRRGLTLNLGLRYEPFTAPDEKHGRESTVKDWVTAAAFDTGAGLFQNPSKKNFSPRVGFAWDVKVDGKTAVRGGFGLFFANIVPSYYTTPASKNPPFYASIETV